MSPELIKIITENISMQEFNIEKSNMFSIGIIILRMSLLLPEKLINKINFKNSKELQNKIKSFLAHLKTETFFIVI